MSELGIDPLAGVAPEAGHDHQREIVADRIRTDAVSLEEANEALKARGIEPLAEGTADYFQARKDALLKDPEFVKSYMAGDTDAKSALLQIDLAILGKSPGRMTDGKPSPASYSAMSREIMRGAPGDATPEGLTEYTDQLSGLMSDLNVPPQQAASFGAEQTSYIRQTAGLDEQAAELRAEREHAALVGAVGEEGIKQANETLAKLGRPVDLNRIVKSSGAKAAILLVFAAQVAKAKSK